MVMTVGMDNDGVTTTQSYDLAGRLTTVAHQGGGVAESFDYTLDAVGDRVAVQSSAGTETYVVDELNRLVESWRGDSNP